MSSLGKPKADLEPLSGQKLRERALDLLSRRDHSERELTRKLKDKGGVLQEIPSLIQDLKRSGYLNDARFAENFVRFRVGKSWGLRRFRQELLVRGVASGVIDSVLREMPEFSDESLSVKLREIVQRENARGKSDEKIMASLLRRGFQAGPVREALREVQNDQTGEDSSWEND